MFRALIRKTLTAATGLALCVLSGCSWQSGGPTSIGAAGASGAISPLPRDEEGLDPRRPLMLGCWIGTTLDEQGRRRDWITERFVDGTFRMKYQVRTARGLAQGEEIGEWGIVGPVFFTQTRGIVSANGEVAVAQSMDGYFDDAYLIESLSDDDIRYSHLGTGIRYSQMRPVALCELPTEPI